jgi:CHAD domain-containing protein
MNAEDRSARAEAGTRRADDFLAPTLFALVARVRREATRVAVGARPGPSSAVDPDAIHDFRVGLRRLRTALRAARELYGKRHVSSVTDELRRYAQAAGALRDEEVLRETLGALPLPVRAGAELTAWLAQRARQERARRRHVGALIAATDAESAAGPPLGDVLARLERRVGHRAAHAVDAVAIAEAALSSAAEEVAARLATHPSNVVGMHDLRIRYKRLRYTADLFAPVLGPRAGTVAREAARMQKQLGELHDLDEALTRLRRARALSEGARAAMARAVGRERARRAAAVGRALAEERRLLRERGAAPRDRASG